MLLASPTAKPVLPLGDPSDTAATMRVTSPYGQRGDFFHGGIDIGNYVAGDTLIACGAGVVTQVGYFGSPKPSDAWWYAQPLNAATGQRGGLYGPPSRWDGPYWGGQQIDLDLGSGWFARYAHADTLTVVKGQRVPIGAKLGTVGDTGSAYRQPHLHLGIHYAGTSVRDGWVDPWPLINGGAHPHLEEDDVKLPADADYFATGKVGPGNRLRIDHTTTDDSEVVKEEIAVQLVGIVTNGTPYSLPDGRSGDRWYVIRRGDTGDVRQIAHLLVTAIAPTPTLFSQIPLPATDCSAQEATIAQLTGKIDRARTANRGAVQAQAAVEGALA